MVNLRTGKLDLGLPALATIRPLQTAKDLADARLSVAVAAALLGMGRRGYFV